MTGPVMVNTSAAARSTSQTLVRKFSLLVFSGKVFNVALVISRLFPNGWRGWLLCAGISTTAWAQAGNAGGGSLPVDVANLREDLRGVAQRVGELTLRIEQLERENAALRRSAEASQRSVAALTQQLNDGLAEANATIKSAVAGAKSETLQQVGAQMEKLAKQTNAALDSLAKNMTTRPAVSAAPAASAEDFPREGVRYTVQSGDNLAGIAKKLGAKQQDIINANKLSDPSHIVVGQTLFVPGGK